MYSWGTLVPMPSSTATLSSTDLWAQPLGDTGGRFRECSPEWYRYSTVQYSTVYCTVMYSTVYNTVYSTVYSTPYCTVFCVTAGKYSSDVQPFTGLTRRRPTAWCRG